jgi:hypothetical protein
VSLDSPSVANHCVSCGASVAGVSAMLCDDCSDDNMDVRQTGIGGISRDTHLRFRDAKMAAQERMGYTELRNEEFVNLLLAVYEHHLDGGGGCDS